MRVLKAARPLARTAGVLACALVAGLAAAGCGERAPAGARAGSGIFPAHPVPSAAGPGAARISRFRWSVLPASPLGRRSHPLLAWTGRELLELGGTRGGQTGSGGAAFDPATGHWHPIAAPGGKVGLPNAVSVWTGRELFVADGQYLPCPALRGGGTPASCWPRAGLYNPAANHWSLTRLPAPMDGIDLMAAVWTGRDVILAGTTRTHDGGLRVAAYDPADGRWRMITPRLPARHPARYVSMVATTGRVILWSLWDRVRPLRNGFSDQAGVDVLARGSDGNWRDVTGGWPQHELVTSPVFAGDAILVSPGQIWCGIACSPPYASAPGFFANPATLARRVIPVGPLGQASPAFIWTGRAIVAVDLDASIGAHGGQGPVVPGDMALWNPATGRWLHLPSPPGLPALAATPVWAGTQLLALARTGRLLAFHGGHGEAEAAAMPQERVQLPAAGAAVPPAGDAHPPAAPSVPRSSIMNVLSSLGRYPANGPHGTKPALS